MANNGYIPGPDTKFENWADQFAKKVGTDFASLGVKEAMSIQLTEDATDFVTKMSDLLNAKIAAKAATEAKNDTRTALESVVRTVAGIIQSNPDVTDEQKKALGLPVHDSVHSVVHPQQPKELNAKGDPAGVNLLNWEPGENKPGTMYVIEAMKQDETGFSYVDVVTKTKYDHKNQKPGEMITYQVKAKRGDEISAPSNAAVVYPMGKSE